jgi:predicted nucleotidyltransferase
MDVTGEYREARRQERLARARGQAALRALVALGVGQREIAEDLGVSQPAVSQQLRTAAKLGAAPAEFALEAAAPILKGLAADRGFTDLAVFGSVARQESHEDSDIDLLVRQPAGTTIADMTRLKDLFEHILGKKVDLITYGALKPIMDADIEREAVRL